MKPEIKVSFQRPGTWGGRTFTATLTWDDPQTDIFTGEPVDGPPSPILILDDGQEGWSGLRIRPGQVIPGRLSSGYKSSLAGQYYIGDMQVGDDARKLRFPVPAAVFPGTPNYLHLVGDAPLTEEQRALLLRAVRFDLDCRFAAGASVTALFTREELEGDKQGQICYSR